MSAERERAAAFGKLDDGLLRAGEWHPLDPYVTGWRWDTVGEDVQGDDVTGLGAIAQTFRPGLGADVVGRRHGAVTSVGDLVREMSEDGPL